MLSDREISFCGISMPKLPDDVMTNTKIGYYRFHGVPELYKSAYADHDLKKNANTMLENKKIKQAFIYFNNTNGPAVIYNTQWVQEYCGEHSHHR